MVSVFGNRMVQLPSGSSSRPRVTRVAISLIAALCLATPWLPWLTASAQDADGVRAGSTITPAVIESKIAEVEATTDLADTAKSQLGFFAQIAGNMQ